MSRTRFLTLLQVIRFDDRETRRERRASDYFAPIRSFWTQFIANFPKYYKYGPHTTIDEMLSLFQGRCPFKVFMEEKPGKYGMLIRMLTDTKMRYILSAEPYTGSKFMSKEDRSPKEVVKRLVETN